jgi:hypothetical protein
MTATADSGSCSACGIPLKKAKRDLSHAEKKIRLHARMIRVVAMLHLVGAGLLFIIPCCFPVPPAVAWILGCINLTLAIGLSRYALWAYRMATVFYFLTGMVHIVSVNIPGILLTLLLLYAVGNGTAKAIFDRRLS